MAWRLRAAIHAKTDELAVARLSNLAAAVHL
jgi:hypothetical protein